MNTASPPKISKAATISTGRYGETVIKRPNSNMPIIAPIRPIAESIPNAVELCNNSGEKEREERGGRQKERGWRVSQYRYVQCTVHVLVVVHELQTHVLHKFTLCQE